ncbi:MAG: bifunctional histidinol-phosphatase/imidazoleglycerol-phosphate dehydratase HisB [Bacteroidales bacterium]|jgi:imidazoleglycerol-phosphate dehydratase/histidinol-phosphatase|nr:bifunctional histidinol-phosphatase/imidazoleglycerol-phosphate dehydratase HisB [Bacteroidales bacterium]
MKRVLFIDRDGTVLTEPEDEQVDSLEKFSFIPGVITGLSRIAVETDYELVMVTNQDGLGTKSFPEDTFWPSQNKMLQILQGEGVRFAEIFIDRSFPEENLPTRKPGTGMLVNYLAKGIDLNDSYVIGDRLTDVELAKNLGCKAIYFNKRKSQDAIFSTTDWNEIYSYLKSIPRIAAIERKTKETDIRLEINLDGTGKSNISTGMQFFDHMLDQIARHGNFDLTITASGDDGTEGHHLIEDLAICMGEALRKAAGSKKGIERYSFVLPMDDCLAQVALDLGGRPWLVWEAEFSGQKIGEIPSEMFFHFFKSFSDNARCNLNIKADGSNEHHKIEAIFKAFARALKMAVKQTDNFNLPTTKGKL